jgi:hypothetical protein
MVNLSIHERPNPLDELQRGKTRTRTIAHDDRRVLGVHPQGGWAVSSEDGITVYQTYYNRCNCKAFKFSAAKCPHIPEVRKHERELRGLRLEDLYD